jgi:DtxR family transcriptional regulator, Mn-dependent transcriptional regulator
MNNTVELSESLEDYLETILDLQTTHKVARSKDIAEKMSIKRGSVTGMLKSLAQKKLINYEPYGFITLTPEGKKIAREIKRRHAIIKDFLFRVLQVDDDKADATACRMEHTMDKSIVNRLVDFIGFIDTCPRTGSQWLKLFREQCGDHEPDSARCADCLTECMADLEE